MDQKDPMELFAQAVLDALSDVAQRPHFPDTLLAVCFALQKHLGSLAGQAGQSAIAAHAMAGIGSIAAAVHQAAQDRRNAPPPASPAAADAPRG